MLNAVIVEDEVSSRETLANYLKEYCPQVNVVGFAANIIEGKEVITAKNPDLVFLDVEMPFGNGFDLLESLDEIRFQTIFVTAFSHYAIRAIQYSASNYILKPIDIDDLIAAVKKVEEHQHAPDSTRILLDNMHVVQKQEMKLVLPVLEGFEIISAKEIIHCEADDNFTRFVLDDNRKLMICRSLKYYQEILEPLGFLRVHKSYLVNVDKIRKYIKGKGGGVVMSDGAELPVSPTKKKELLDSLRLT